MIVALFRSLLFRVAVAAVAVAASAVAVAAVAAVEDALALFFEGPHLAHAVRFRLVLGYGGVHWGVHWGTGARGVH